MINVNWKKVKKYEKKGFAFSLIFTQLLIALIFLIIGMFNSVNIINYVSALIIVVIAGFYIHIESRMLQIYMLLSILDISFCLFTFVNISKEGEYSALLITLAILLITIILAVIVKSYVCENTLYKPTDSSNNELFKNKSVMFFAPHEDDEINVFGGIIEQYVKNGSSVRIVFMTNGDCYGIGSTRIKEALDVADVYSIPRENIIFLGYSDSLVKNGTHIYNASENEEYISVKGYSETYCSKLHSAFISGKKFTRENVVNDFTEVIKKYAPDELFCCDYDSHSDHRALSLFFEEAIDRLLTENNSYTPAVYKGFAYSTAWNGKKDYYSLNIVSTRKVTDTPLMEENGIYEWDKRIRFPVADEFLSRIMQNSSSYKAMMKHSSQTATDHANGILNGDKVFWNRRTDSVLINSEIVSTSGDASKITEFKLIDSENIIRSDALPCSNAWVADEGDNNRIVMISLPEKKTINEIRIYASPVKENKIIDATVKIGNYQFNTGLINNCESFEIDSVEADKLAVRIDEFTGDCSILKIEAFENRPDSSTKLIKLMNKNNDFCYDYIIKKSGKEELFVYTYPNTNSPFDISLSGAVKAEVTENGILVKCKTNENGKLKVSLKENPEIFDEINISNPDDKQRRAIFFKQSLEQLIWTFPMQKDYYLGLIRRLGVYKK